MKFVLVVVLLCSATGAAQDARALPQTEVSSSIKEGTWDLGVVASGGTGLGFAKDTQFAAAGGRAGLILTKEHGNGWSRGNFEWAIEVLPLYEVLTPRRPVYGVGVIPAIWRWNFTSGKKIAPYASLAGGLLFSTQNLPPGQTSWVNFTPQASIGANFLTSRGNAFLFEGIYVHHSNAGLGTYNPGYNSGLFFSVGYTWFK